MVTENDRPFADQPHAKRHNAGDRPGCGCRTSRRLGVPWYHTRVRKADRACDGPKKHALDAAEAQGHRCVVACDFDSDRNKAFGSLPAADNLAALLLRERQRPPSIYEVLHARCQLYADVDGELPADMTREQFLARFFEVTEAALEAAGLPAFQPDLARLTTSRGADAPPDKLSFHFAYGGAHSELPAGQLDFWQRVWAGERERLYPEWYWLKERADGRLERREFVDLAVYNTDRQMRTVYSTKYGKDKALVPCDARGEPAPEREHDSPLPWLIGHVDDDASTPLAGPNPPRQQPLRRRVMLLPRTEAQVRELLESKVPDVEWGGRRDALFLLRNRGERACLVTPGSTHRRNHCYAFFRRGRLLLRCHATECRGSEHVLATFDGGTGAAALDGNDAAPTAADDRDWTFFDVFRMVDGRLPCTLEELDACMAATMVRVVNGGGHTCTWTKGDDGGEVCWQAAGDVFEKRADRHLCVTVRPRRMTEDEKKQPWVVFTTPVDGDDTVRVVVSLAARARFLMASGRIRHYSRVDCVPYFHPDEPLPLQAEREHVFNLFRGFPLARRADDVAPPTDTEIAEFDEIYLAHMRHVICDGHADMFAYLVRYVCHMLTRPAELPGKSLAFVSSMEGAGKDTWIDSIKELIGLALWADISTAQLGKDFNMMALNRLLVYSPEAVPLRDFNKLKADITAPVKRYEPKGKEAFQARHFARYWFTANSDWVVNAEVSNRRFMIYRVSNARVGDRAYFARLREYLARPRTLELAWLHFTQETRLPDGWHPGSDHVDAHHAAAATVLQSKPGRVWAFLSRLATGLLQRPERCRQCAENDVNALCANGRREPCAVRCLAAWEPGVEYTYTSEKLHELYTTSYGHAGHGHEGNGHADAVYNRAHFGRQLARFGCTAKMRRLDGRAGLPARVHCFNAELLAGVLSKVLRVPVPDLQTLRQIMLSVDGLVEDDDEEMEAAE